MESVDLPVWLEILRGCRPGVPEVIWSTRLWPVMTTRDGYSVRLPSEGNRVVQVSSEKNAKVIAEAETLRQKLAAR